MLSRRVISTVESHTDGMATRVVTGGVPALPGATMEERRQRLVGFNGCTGSHCTSPGDEHPRDPSTPLAQV